VGKTNAQWHAANRMPKNPTDAQRVQWHMRHAEYCKCRPIPKSVQALIDAKRESPVATAGYSGKPLLQKLGVKEGFHVRLIDAPASIAPLITASGAHFQSRANASTDLVHLFVTKQSKLAQQLKSLRALLRPDATVWVSWPKKSSKVLTDVTEDSIRAVALPMGWVDIKVCAVDTTWSGLKLVVRKELR
jgi:hypothetical protein